MNTKFKVSRRNIFKRFCAIAISVLLIIISFSGCFVLNMLLSKQAEEKIDYSDVDVKSLNDVKSCKKIGEALIEAKTFFKARKVFHRALELEPNDPEVNNLLGRAYYLTSDYEKAKLFLRTAIAIKPKYADAYYNLGDVYFSEGDLDAAMNNFKTAININPAYRKRIRHFFGEDFMPLE